MAYKANSATATFHVDRGEVLLVGIPGEEGPVVLSCPPEQLPCEGADQLWAPLACLLDILLCLWLSGYRLPLCISSRTCLSPWSLYLVHSSPSLGPTYLFLPGCLASALFLDPKCVCLRCVSLCLSVCGLPVVPLPVTWLLSISGCLCLTLAGSALDCRGGGVGETINQR